MCALLLGVVVEALGWLGALELELELELGWGWEGNTACELKGSCGGGSRCGSIGREALVLVFRCVCRTKEKSFRDRVAYW